MNKLRPWLIIFAAVAFGMCMRWTTSDYESAPVSQTAPEEVPNEQPSKDNLDKDTAPSKVYLDKDTETEEHKELRHRNGVFTPKEVRDWDLEWMIKEGNRERGRK